MDFELINPRQTILVTCRGKAKVMGKDLIKDDAIAIDWHMPTSFKPVYYAISVGKARFSYKLISESKVFVINYMPYSMEKEVLFCGRHSGQFIDKFKEAKIEKAEAMKVDCPVIKEAIGWSECQVEQEIDTGDHVIFIGRMVAERMAKQGERRLFHLGDDSFGTVK